MNTPTAWPVAFDLVIAPQADGLALAPTLSFGKAGDIVALHLNAAMKDPVAAGASDGHSERTTLQLSGFPDGDKVVFHANGTALDASRVSFAGGVYTITGLSQAELDGLGFQHGGTGGTQTIDVTAWTQEVDPTGHPVGAPSAPVVSSQITINVADKLPTPGADTLLWTGSLLDGRDGDDTLQLRYGENLAGSDLAAALRNIEKIELGVTSDNTISGLNVADVFDMTDTRNALEILGNGQDTVHLEGGWNNDGNGIFTGLHSGQAITLTVQAGVETYLNGVLIE